MTEHDAETIDAVCELIFNTASLEGQNHIVRFKGEFDPSARVAYFSMVLSPKVLPPDLRKKVTPDVEKQVVAFFRDLDVVVKVVDDPKWGRCFAIDLPGELRGASWDDFIGRRKPGGI